MDSVPSNCTCPICKAKADSLPSPYISTNRDKPLPPVATQENARSQMLPPDLDRKSRTQTIPTAVSMRDQGLRKSSPNRRVHSLSEKTTFKEMPLKNFFSKPYPGEKSHEVFYQEVEVASMDDDGENKISPNDIVIAVMGVTGAGKTTFIQDLTDEKLVIGNNLASCTSVVSPHKCNQPGYENVWLIDTPGFDDSHRTDADILHEIAEYLVQASADEIFLTGIIYLHRIQDPRIGQAAMKNIRTFKKLCGQDGLSRTTLVTTFWKSVEPEEGRQREEELLTKDDLWRVIKEKGGRAFRYEHKDKSSAKVVVEHIVSSKLGPKMLQFQQEMEDGRAIKDTKAGMEVDAAMEKLKSRHKAEIEKLRKELEEAKRVNDSELEQIKEEFEEAQEKLRKATIDHELLAVKKESLKKRLRAKAVRAAHGKCSVM